MRNLRHVAWLIGFVVLMTIAASACGQASGGAPSTSPFNVSGSVQLREPAGQRSGGGLTVTARSPRAHTRLATTQTAADGTFRFQLKPGWYLLTVDYWGGPALQVHVPKYGVASATIVGPTEELARSRLVTVNDVPDVLPPLGVRLSLAVLRPPPKQLPRSLISEEEAIAGRESDGSSPTRAVLAVVTARGARVGLKNPTKPLRDWLALVVVSERQRPIDCVIGGYVPEGVSRTPGLATHSISLIDARTGQFLLGCFTK